MDDFEQICRQALNQDSRAEQCIARRIHMLNGIRPSGATDTLGIQLPRTLSYVHHAFQWLERAANHRQGDEDLNEIYTPRYELGCWYEEIHAYPQAIKQFEQASDEGGVESALRLGTFYACGKGIERNIVRACAYFVLGSQIHLARVEKQEAIKRQSASEASASSSSSGPSADSIPHDENPD